MRAFTVHQPYAYAIVAGLKGYETRPGGPTYGVTLPSTPGKPGWSKRR